jgi:hypothetical protein
MALSPTQSAIPAFLFVAGGKSLKRTLIGLVALAAATPAFAGTVSYDAYSVVDGSVTTNITFPVTLDVYTGQIDLWSGGKQVAAAWCVDLFDDLQHGGVYNVVEARGLPFTYETGTGPITLSHDQIGEIGGLVDQGNRFVKFGEIQEQAAVQMAIWNVAFGATFSGGPTGLAQTYVDDIVGGGWARDYNVRFLSPVEGANQTLAFAAAEPSTWAMIGLGFLGLASAAHARKRPVRYAI